MILYGLKSCDTCRKALKALADEGRAVTFRDVRAAPLTSEEIAELHALFGEKLLNRGSTTWRSLSEEERTAPEEALIAAHPALMKRPVIRHDDGHYTLGWPPRG